MKKFLVLLFVLSISQSAFAESRIIRTSVPANNYGYYNNGYNVSDYNFNRLSEIENIIFGHDYYGQNIITRVERLEDAVLNRRYPNSTLEQRINNIIYNYNRNNSITDNTKTNKVRKIVDGISSAFFGTPTGYTPPISDPYYSWGSNGIGQHYGNYSDYYGSNGWHRYGRSLGTGSGVRIID